MRSRLGDRLASDEFPEQFRLAVGRVVVEDRQACLGREERPHGGAVAPIVSPDIVGENLLDGQFVRHQDLFNTIDIRHNTLH
jgi:hypothetical protein